MPQWIRSAVRICALAAPLAAIASAQAALPPEHQRVRELKAILDSGAVLDALGYEEIDALIWVGPDHYRVASDSCAVEVYVVTDRSVEHEPGWAGPRAFLIEVGATYCE